MPVYDRVKKVARSNGRDAINRAKSKVPGGLNPAGLKAALGKRTFLATMQEWESVRMERPKTLPSFHKLRRLNESVAASTG